MLMIFIQDFLKIDGDKETIKCVNIYIYNIYILVIYCSSLYYCLQYILLQWFTAQNVSTYWNQSHV